MSWDLILKALLSTYLISIIIFMIWTYAGAGRRVERVMYALLWPFLITLIVFEVITRFINDIVTAILDAFWMDDEEEEDPEKWDDDDDDEGKPA